MSQPIETKNSQNVRCPNCRTRLVKANKDGLGVTVFAKPFVIFKSQAMAQCPNCKHCVVLPYTVTPKEEKKS